MELLNMIGTVLPMLLGWIGDVAMAVIGSTGALNVLLPLFALGICGSLIFLGFKVIKSLIWGA